MQTVAQNDAVTSGRLLLTALKIIISLFIKVPAVQHTVSQGGIFTTMKSLQIDNTSEHHPAQKCIHFILGCLLLHTALHNRCLLFLVTEKLHTLAAS